jgi:uncharacterized protein
MILHSSFDTIGRHWRSKIEDSHDFQVVRNDSVFRAGFSSSPVFESDYRTFRELMTRHLDRYDGMSVEDAFEGKTIDTPEGECFEIITRPDIQVRRPDPERIRNRLLEELTLVRGIGPVNAGLLRRKGYRKLQDLVTHRRFRNEAKECISLILEGCPGEIVSFVEHRHSPSHPLSLLASGLYGCHSYLFLDLETLGFFSRPVILFGFARVENLQLVVHQLLVRGMDEELPALCQTTKNIRENAVVITYNGKTFDLPYLVSRSAYYGEEMEKPCHHIDLLHASRRHAGHLIKDCRLSTIERYLLGTSRSHDLPGSMVPEFYEKYLQSGNPGPLVPIVEHNLEDVVSLSKLLFRFIEGIT